MPRKNGSETRKTIRPTYWLASLDPSLMKDKQAEGIQRPLLSLFAATVFVLVMFGFAGKLLALQVASGARFEEMANGNRIREHIQYAERGTIYDRHGEVIATNVAGYQIHVNPYQLPEVEDERNAVYEKISRAVGLSNEEVKGRAEGQGLNYVLPIAIGRQVNQKVALKLELELESLPGVHMGVVPTRHYVTDAGLAHILGYTSLVTEDDLKERDDLAFVDYIGRSGVEAQYDDALRGVNGHERYEVDALGKPLRLLTTKPSEAGNDIYLTIDLGLQRSLYKETIKAMKAQGSKRASATMIDPNSGEVLAMVSIPTYDNNLFAAGISTADYKKLNTNPDNPLYNKAISGGYPSGSIIKPIVASAGLQEGVINEKTVVVDRGYIDVPNQYGGAAFRFYGWRRSGLGPMNVRRALAMSSNIFFFSVGGGHGHVSGLGSERLTNYYRMFGLGAATGIDLPGETTGLVPDASWKEEQGGLWTVGDTYNISIGQGDLKVNTVQMATATNAIANGGTVYQPHVLLRIAGQEKVQPTITRKVSVDEKNLKIVREGMREMVTNGSACTCRFVDIPVPFAGKSGTAETKLTQSQKTADHGWFVSFAPYDNPKVGVAVLIEEGGTGAAAAVPVVNKVFSYYFRR